MIDTTFPCGKVLASRQATMETADTSPDGSKVSVETSVSIVRRSTEIIFRSDGDCFVSALKYSGMVAVGVRWRAVFEFVNDEQTIFRGSNNNTMAAVIDVAVFRRMSEIKGERRMQRGEMYDI